MATRIARKETYEDKIQWAMSTIVEHDGYCEVASRSEQAPHIVPVNKWLYSTDCTCKAAQSGVGCFHRAAVDEYYADKRPSFHEQCGLDSPTVASVEHFLKAERQEQAVIFGTCGHRVKDGKWWLDCGCRS